MMQHKGYIGVARVDAEAGLIRGRVVNTRDLITFHGGTVAEARRAFQESVEDYLEFCAARGEEAEKPFSGRFVVRMKPQVHETTPDRCDCLGIARCRGERRLCIGSYTRDVCNQLQDPPETEPSTWKPIAESSAAERVEAAEPIAERRREIVESAGRYIARVDEAVTHLARALEES